MSEPVPSITSAPEPLAVDQARRTRSYLIQMSIRVVCIIGAVLVDGWLRWALVAAAVVLPYSAVLIANSGRDKVTHDASPVTPPAAPALTELPDSSGGPAGGNGSSGGYGFAGGTGFPGGTGGAGSGRVIDHVDDPTEDRAEAHADDRAPANGQADAHTHGRADDHAHGRADDHAHDRVDNHVDGRADR